MGTTIGNRPAPAPALQRTTPSTSTSTTPAATTEQSPAVKRGWVSGNSPAAKQQALAAAYTEANLNHLAEVVAKANGLESPQTAMNALANAYASQGRAGVSELVDAASKKLETRSELTAGFHRAAEPTQASKRLAFGAGAAVSMSALAIGPAGFGLGAATMGGIIAFSKRVTPEEVKGVMDRAIANQSPTGKLEGLSAEQKKMLADEFRAAFEQVSREHPKLVTNGAIEAYRQQMNRLN